MVRINKDDIHPKMNENLILQEIENLRAKLKIAEEALKDSCFCSPGVEDVEPEHCIACEALKKIRGE